MWATYPCGELRDGCEESTSQLHTFFLEKVTYEVRYFIEWGVQRFGGGHQFWCCVFAGRGFDTFCFFLGLTSSLPRDYCLFGLRLLRPGRFLVAFTIDF
jgi:hypothetical protein